MGLFKYISKENLLKTLAELSFRDIEGLNGMLLLGNRTVPCSIELESPNKIVIWTAFGKYGSDSYNKKEFEFDNPDGLNSFLDYIDSHVMLN